MIKPDYKYTLEIRPTAQKILESLPKNLRQQIGYSLHLLQRDLTGDIKKLKGYNSSTDYAWTHIAFALS